MAYQLEDVEFPRNSLYVGHVFDFIFLQDFDGHGLEGVIVDGLFDFSESALTDSRSSYFALYSMV